VELFPKEVEFQRVKHRHDGAIAGLIDDGAIYAARPLSVLARLVT
jgi:hypothetical protein